MRQQGSRKSQRSEIFGKRSTGSAHASIAPRGDARVLPTAPTKKRGFACAKGNRNRARSPLFGKVASMRQIECAYRKASFSDAQFDYGKRGLSFCVALSGAATKQAFPCHPERSGVAAQSKDLYSDFVDIFIEIPLCARDDRGRGCLFVSF